MDTHTHTEKKRDGDRERLVDCGGIRITMQTNHLITELNSRVCRVCAPPLPPFSDLLPCIVGWSFWLTQEVIRTLWVIWFVFFLNQSRNPVYIWICLLICLAAETKTEFPGWRCCQPVQSWHKCKFSSFYLPLRPRHTTAPTLVWMSSVITMHASSGPPAVEMWLTGIFWF